MTGVTSVTTFFSLIFSVTNVKPCITLKFYFLHSNQPELQVLQLLNSSHQISVTSDTIYASQVFSVHSAPRITFRERVDRKHLAYEDGVIQALQPSFSCATSVTTFIFYLLSTSIPVLQVLQPSFSNF